MSQQGDTFQGELFVEQPTASFFATVFRASTPDTFEGHIQIGSSATDHYEGHLIIEAVSVEPEGPGDTPALTFSGNVFRPVINSMITGRLEVGGPEESFVGIISVDKPKRIGAGILRVR